MVILKDLRKTGIERLKKCGSDSPVADVDFILYHSFGIDKTDIILGSKHISESEYALFDCMIKKCESGEPVQYAVGKTEFMGLDFFVNKSTLIPRFDTEILVENVISRLKSVENVNILDIGCGSGCIGISLAKFLPNSKVHLIDISADTLEIAKKNALINDVLDKTKFLHQDIFNDCFDLFKKCPYIVSNPPYIQTYIVEGLEPKVKDFEPFSALDGGNDGLDFYKRIIDIFNPEYNVFLAFEIGFDQGISVKELMNKSNKFNGISLIKDISGNDRVLIGIV